MTFEKIDEKINSWFWDKTINGLKRGKAYKAFYRSLHKAYVKAFDSKAKGSSYDPMAGYDEDEIAFFTK